MVGKVRIEYPGAFYQVLNRGNYRDFIFDTEGAISAILLEHEAVGPVCRHIPLNPVRAKLTGVQKLKDYKGSSFHQLWHAAKRWPFLDPLRVLEEAGGLPDTPAGRRSYRDYLSWLAERLNMGTPQSLASRVSAHRLNTRVPDAPWRTLKMLECVDCPLLSSFLPSTTATRNLYLVSATISFCYYK